MPFSVSRLLGALLLIGLLLAILAVPATANAEVDRDQIRSALRIPMMIGLGLGVLGGLALAIANLAQRFVGDQSKTE